MMLRVSEDGSSSHSSPRHQTTIESKSMRETLRSAKILQDKDGPSPQNDGLLNKPITPKPRVLVSARLLSYKPSHHKTSEQRLQFLIDFCLGRFRTAVKLIEDEKLDKR